MASGGSPDQVVSDVDEDAEDWVPMPTHLRNSRKTLPATTQEASTAAPRDTRDTREKMKLVQQGVWAALEGMEDDPDAAWEVMRQTQVVRRRRPIPLSSEQPPGTTRFVCMSDTHNLHDRVDVPPGDVFIHAGDFTMTGLPAEVENFNEFLGRLPHKEKIVIAGNHELTFDAESYPRTWDRFGHPEAYDCEAVRRSLTNCTYLEDSEVTVRGYRIYGSPWQPEFCNWAFNLTRGEKLAKRWSIIPPGVDILVTHGPPLGHGDQLTRSRQRTGCVDLLRAVQTIRPLYHIFGHMHEGYGMTEDGIGTIYVNASTCNDKYQPINPCIIFDLPNKA